MDAGNGGTAAVRVKAVKAARVRFFINLSISWSGEMSGFDMHMGLRGSDNNTAYQQVDLGHQPEIEKLCASTSCSRYAAQSAACPSRSR